MKNGVLGAFEEMVLLAVVHQAENAYGVSVRRELAERSGTDVSVGALYATLDRLEAKGLIEGRVVARRESRPGRPRRYYSVLPEGRAALEDTRRIRATMWRGVDLGDLRVGGTG